nr:reverse transcriptase domain-containing protein [Tanacetum cinerariifolium]
MLELGLGIKPEARLTPQDAANIKIYDGTGDPEDHVGRFVGIGNQGEWPMPIWCRMFQQTLDGKARAWFDKLPPGSIDNWCSLQEKFLNRFGMLKAFDKDPTKILKIVCKANETLPRFKERWVGESNAILDVPELMQISSFMSSHKCPELAKRFSDSIPRIVDEMLKRVDDYLRSKEAFRSIELPRGEFQRRDAPVQWVQRNDRNQRFYFRNNRHRLEHKPVARISERHAHMYHHSSNQEFRRPRAVLTLDSLSSTSQEILAMEHQLNLPQPAPLVGVPSKENLNRYCDYHNEKGHNTNDCFHLKQQLEIALESGKLNHLVKNVRQKGRRGGEENHDDGCKMDECSYNLPSVIVLDLSEEALVVEAKVKGYLKIGKEADIRTTRRERDTGYCRPNGGGIVRPVRYPTWISNPVLVKKADEIWRMCIDFKNINAACPKDYYPLPEIDSKIEAVMGFPLKCFLDAFKGYHQVQMAKEAEEKTSFYTDQGTYCYTKMPFGLKNAGATYQRLVDEAFQPQIGRNLKVYVDDMVIKSKSEREMLADITETFDNLRRINMKLNPKSKNQRHSKNAVAQSLREMQSLAGKLAALNRFLYRKRFQRAQEDGPGPTGPNDSSPERNLICISSGITRSSKCSTVSGKAWVATPVHYVSRTLHDADRNYAPLEKVALALRHASRRLR